MTASTTVAAFDFDGTLTHRDSVVPFLRRVAGTRRLLLGSVPDAHRLVAAAAGRDRDRLRSIATKVAFSGRPVADVREHADRHGHELVERGLRGDTVARLRWHAGEGHRVVIVSASYEDYLHVVAAQLGIDAVLATRLEVVDHHCTGRLDGPNCRGPEKARRLAAWFDEAGLARSAVTVWAYGDSRGDDEMLAMADHPVMARRPLGSVAPTV